MKNLTAKNIRKMVTLILTTYENDNREKTSTEEAFNIACNTLATWRTRGYKNAESVFYDYYKRDIMPPLKVKWW